ncbi:hypothetical protein D3C80_1077490 [compost metagenome]
MQPGLLALGSTDTAEQIHWLAEAFDQLLCLLPAKRLRLRMSLRRLHRRQGDEIHPHLFGQCQLFSVMTRRRQPALRRKRPAFAGVLAQLFRGQVPARRGEITQPLQRPLEHQLRLAGAQAYSVHRHVAVLGVVHVRGTQLHQLDPAGNGLLDSAQHLRDFQAFRGNQVFTRQACRGDDRPIGLGEVILRQFTRRHPGQRLAFGAMGLTGKTTDFPDIQQHLLVRVVVVDLDQRPRGSDDNAQLFVQLAGQGDINRLAILDLTARKLPQTTLMLGIGATGNQDSAIRTANDRCGYMYAFHPSRSARPAFCQAWKAGHW